MPRRPLTRGERQKLFAFLGILFLLANVFLGTVLLHRFQDDGLRLQRLRAEASSARAWLDDKGLWEQRAAWLAQKQPKLQDIGQGNVALLESLQKLAQQYNLSIDEQNLKDSRTTPFYREVSVQLRLTGTLEAMCRWATQVQQPEAFQAVTNFSLKSDGTDTTKVRCELTVTRWYAPH